jgi:hypothetical protein
LEYLCFVKKTFHKTLSLILLPLMVFAYSGSGVHYHFCGKTGEVFTSVLFPLSSQAESGACLCSHEETGCCSREASRAMAACNDRGDTGCCADYTAGVHTDVHFPAGYNVLHLISPPVFVIAESTSPGVQVEDITRVPLIYSPPNQALLSVFRL